MAPNVLKLLFVLLQSLRFSKDKPSCDRVFYEMTAFFDAACLQQPRQISLSTAYLQHIVSTTVAHSGRTAFITIRIAMLRCIIILRSNIISNSELPFGNVRNRFLYIMRHSQIIDDNLIHLSLKKLVIQKIFYSSLLIKKFASFSSWHKDTKVFLRLSISHKDFTKPHVSL